MRCAGKAHCRVQPKLEPARSAGPRAYLVINGEHREAIVVGVADVRAHGGEEDVECHMRRRRGAE